MRMPFGRHRGEDLDDIEDSYLLWCLANVQDMNPFLKEAIKDRLGMNKAKAPPPPPPRQPPPPPPGAISKADLDAAIKGWYRTLAVAWHPDKRKGSNEGMVAINQANEELRKRLSL